MDAVRFRVLNAPRRIAAGAVENLRAVGRDVSLHFTAGPGHAAELARTLVEQGCQRLIVCGGDGTVNEVLPAVAHREVTLGLIPAGTGNDFARALSIPRSGRATVRLQICGQPRRFDLGRCGERYFCTVAAFGFDALVASPSTTGGDAAACFDRLPDHSPICWRRSSSSPAITRVKCVWKASSESAKVDSY